MDKKGRFPLYGQGGKGERMRRIPYILLVSHTPPRSLWYTLFLLLNWEFIAGARSSPSKLTLVGLPYSDCIPPLPPQFLATHSLNGWFLRTSFAQGR